MMEAFRLGAGAVLAPLPPAGLPLLKASVPEDRMERRSKQLEKMASPPAFPRGIGLRNRGGESQILERTDQVVQDLKPRVSSGNEEARRN